MCVMHVVVIHYYTFCVCICIYMYIYCRHMLYVDMHTVCTSDVYLLITHMRTHAHTHTHTHTHTTGP